VFLYGKKGVNVVIANGSIFCVRYCVTRTASLLLLLCCCPGNSVAAGPENEFTGDSFAGLSVDERELLAELSDGMGLVTAAYASLTLNAVERVYERPNDETSSATALRLAVTNHFEIHRDSTAYYAVVGDRRSEDGSQLGDALLVNPEMGWSLRRDQTTQKYFVSRYGKQFTARHWQSDEWWVDAAYSMKIRSVVRALLTNSPHTIIRSVEPAVDKNGERMIVVVRGSIAKISRPGDELHDETYERIRFYRDHLCVLKDFEDFGYVVGTDQQIQLWQRCQYRSLDAPTPILSHVTLEQFRRPLAERNDDAKWKPFIRTEVDFVDVELKQPDQQHFRIQSYVPDFGISRSPRSSNVHWILLLNGLLFLGVWFVLRKKLQSKV